MKYWLTLAIRLNVVAELFHTTKKSSYGNSLTRGRTGQGLNTLLIYYF